MNRYPEQYWPRRIARTNIHIELKYTLIVLNSGCLFELIIRVSCHNQLHYTFFPIFGRILQFQPTTVTNNYKTVFRTSHKYKKQHVLQIIFCACVKIEIQRNLSVLKKEKQNSFIYCKTLQIINLKFQCSYRNNFDILTSRISVFRLYKNRNLLACYAHVRKLYIFVVQQRPISTELFT